MFCPSLCQYYNFILDKYIIRWYTPEIRKQFLILDISPLARDTEVRGKENLSLAAEVAKLYYLEQKTQNEISQIIGRSRPTVVRLLKLARDENLIDIHIRNIADPEEKAKQLAHKLCSIFGSLNEDYTRILYTHSVGDVLGEKLGRLGAEVIEEIIFQVHKEKIENPNVSHRVRLGVGMGSQVRFVADSSYPKRICEDLVVIPLIGGFGKGEEMQRNDSSELSRRSAKHYRGTWEKLLCPAKVSSSEIKKSLLKEEVISHVMREGRNCDIYLMGMGGVRSDAVVRFVPEGAGLLTEDLLTQMARTKGVVGTICAQMYTVEGEDCPYPEGNGAIMGISLNDLRRSAKNGSYVLVVAGGETRHRAVLGALKTGCVNCIVTDQRCAEWVLEQEEKKGRNILE